MAVFTKINKRDIYNIQNFFNIGKIVSYHGIKEGIENTNYLISTKKQKFILTIFEKRVKKTDLPFFMKLMDKLSNLKIKCPSPLKSKEGKYLFSNFHFTYFYNRSGFKKQCFKELFWISVFY